MNAYEKALSLLAVREHSKRELEEKLSRKGYGKDETEEALNRLIEEGLQSDSRYCENYIRLRLRKTPEGSSLIKRRLMEKGISPSLAASSVQDYFESHEEEIKEIFRSCEEKLVSKKGVEKARATLWKKGIRTGGPEE